MSDFNFGEPNFLGAASKAEGISRELLGVARDIASLRGQQQQPVEQSR